MALDAHFAVHDVKHDYGFDMYIETYDAHDHPENGYVQIQAKGRSKPKRVGDTFRVAVKTGHVKLWLGEFYPMLLVLHDEQTGLCHWVNIQDYMAGQDLPDSRTMTIQIPVANVLTPEVYQAMRTLKNQKHSEAVAAAGAAQ